MGDAKTLTLGALKKMEQAKEVILQTGEIPAAAELVKRGIKYSTLDELYLKAMDFDELGALTVEYLRDKEGVVFCVMGSITGNSLAQAVIENVDVEEVIPGVSFAENAISACGLFEDFLQESPAAAFVDKYFLPDEPVVITEVDSEFRASDIALKLLEFYPPDYEVYLVRGSDCECVTLRELPNKLGWSYACSIVVPGTYFMDKEKFLFIDLIRIMSKLRDPDGCPWDRKQTHKSLRKYLLEECYEVLNAIDAEDDYALMDELGDLLLQVVFHARIAEERSVFMPEDVTTAICKKLINRHTHIFGSDECNTAEDVHDLWEKNKREEKGQTTYTEALKDSEQMLSAIMRAEKIQKKAAAVGFDFPSYEGALEKLHEEMRELESDIANKKELEEESGDVLFAAINVFRHLGINGDVALNMACKKFINRFELMESEAVSLGKDLSKLTLEEQDLLYNKAKNALKA